MMEDTFVNDTCKPFTKAACRYTAMGPTGWRCLKLTPLAARIERRIAEGSMKATGDNCPGIINDDDVR